jgi:hypothetical protein
VPDEFRHLRPLPGEVIGIGVTTGKIGFFDFHPVKFNPGGVKFLWPSLSPPRKNRVYVSPNTKPIGSANRRLTPDNFDE